MADRRKLARKEATLDLQKLKPRNPGLDINTWMMNESMHPGRYRKEKFDPVRAKRDEKEREERARQEALTVDEKRNERDHEWKAISPNYDLRWKRYQAMAARFIRGGLSEEGEKRYLPQEEIGKHRDAEGQAWTEHDPERRRKSGPSRDMPR